MMQITIDIKGLNELQKTLQDFSERRMAAAVATALTRTAQAVSKDWQQQINTRIDRPTARTQAAAGFAGASAQKLEARVFLKDRLAGTSPAAYLAPQELGGNRLLKKFERALVSSGAMPQGFVTVPGRYAQLDGYGNMSRGQLIAVIRALGADYSPGYQQTISKSTAKRLSAQAKHGRKYIAVSPQEAGVYKVSPGIYERMADGSRKAVMLFKSEVGYKRRLNLVDQAGEQNIRQTFEREVTRSIDESLQRLAAKGAR